MYFYNTFDEKTKWLILVYSLIAPFLFYSIIIIIIIILIVIIIIILLLLLIINTKSKEWKRIRWTVKFSIYKREKFFLLINKNNCYINSLK